PHARVRSAFGAMLPPLRLDLVRSSVFRSDLVDWGEVDRLAADMRAEGEQVLLDAGCAPAGVHFTYELDMRYVGQQHELKVELPGRMLAARDVTAIRKAFETEYDRVYRIIQSEVEIEIV